MINGVENENPDFAKDFDDYIDRIWLEITCGEAPFIANRYEMESGDLIDLPDRTGFLDRKLKSQTFFGNVSVVKKTKTKKLRV